MNIGSMGVLFEAMPSVKKASAEVSPRALREVDRLNKNPEKGMQTQAVKTSAVFYSILKILNLENIQSRMASGVLAF